jgi:hypothetical protein
VRDPAGGFKTRRRDGQPRLRNTTAKGEKPGQFFSFLPRYRRFPSGRDACTRGRRDRPAGDQRGEHMNDETRNARSRRLGGSTGAAHRAEESRLSIAHTRGPQAGRKSTPFSSTLNLRGELEKSKKEQGGSTHSTLPRGLAERGRKSTPLCSPRARRALYARDPRRVDLDRFTPSRGWSA